MPRAYDPDLPGGGLPITHSPLNRIRINPVVTPFDLQDLIDQLIISWENIVRDYIIPAIKTLTGIDLTTFLDLFESIFGASGIDLSSFTKLFEGIFDAIGLDLPELAGLNPITLFEQLFGFIPGLGGAGGPDAENFINFILNPTGLLTTLADIVDAIYEALTNVVRGPGDPFTDLQEVLQNIPFFNILGIGGPGNIGGSVQATWDQLIGGLVGAIGTGAGLSDLFNISQVVSSRATLGQFSWDILGIRNNRPLNSGFFPTTRSNIGLDSVALAASPPLLTITETTALTSYERISENLSVGLVSWQGQGVVNITDCRINLYKMNPVNGVNSLVHASTNQAGLLSGSMAQVVYSLPAAISFLATEIIGVEIVTRGAGTHSIAGKTTWLPNQAVFPQRYGSRRNSSADLAPSSFSPSYSSDVAFIEFGVTAGAVSIPHTPEPWQFNTVGFTSLPIPSWANFVDGIALGAGGGGHGGAVLGGSGAGGNAGTWGTMTWTRGSHFTGSASVSITVGCGGSSGGFAANGGNGSLSSATVASFSVNGSGGAGGSSLVIGSLRDGKSPGNQNYLGITYVGGGTQGSAGANGAAPGGGGAGGGGSQQFGGVGAAGAVWVRFRQS